MAADRLGHAHVSMTQNTYYGREVRATGAKKFMEKVDVR